ncbi:MAG: glycosyltransferase family 87 protein [Terracidiphilus sp.]
MSVPKDAMSSEMPPGQDPAPGRADQRPFWRRRAPRRASQIALAVAFACCLAASGVLLSRPHMLSATHQVDFKVYYVAAEVVHEGLDGQLYTDAGNGKDPQLRRSSPNSVFSRAGMRRGVGATYLYLYPPLLADMLLPIRSISPIHAQWAWMIANLLATALIIFILAQLHGSRKPSLNILLLLAGMFCFRPFWVGLLLGQVVTLLLLLWVASSALYVAGWKRASALVISLAVAIKLTPLLIVVPMLIWGEWKWLRWFSAGVIGTFLIMCWRNTPGTVLFYFFHVMPPMSAGISTLGNKSIPAAVSVLWRGGEDLHGVDIHPLVVIFGKLLCLGIIACAGFFTIKARQELTKERKILILACYALLSICLAPVSLMHAYVIGFFALATFWRRALIVRVLYPELALLVAASATIGGADMGGVCRKLGPHFYVLAFGAPILGAALALYGLGLDRPFGSETSTS